MQQLLLVQEHQYARPSLLSSSSASASSSPAHFVMFKPPPPRVTLRKSKVLLRSNNNSRHRNLAERLVGDVVIGCGVTAVVSPFLTVIDKALVQKSAGTHSVVGSMLDSTTSMLRRPVSYFKSPTFLWMWATYAATYSVANSIKTLTEHHHQTQTQSQLLARKTAPTTASPSTNGNIAVAATSPSAKSNVNALSAGAIFLGTTIANTTACLAKDRAYAKMFGNPAATTVPKISYAAWLLRDFSVIGSSFILPDYVAPTVQETFSLNENAARHVAQVGTPMAAQLVAGPLHFAGLDCYNRDLSSMKRLSSRVLDRSRFLARTFKSVALARMVRVLPGYGVAGVWNAQLRTRWQSHLKQKEVRKILTRAAGRNRSGGDRKNHRRYGTAQPRATM